MLKIKFTLCLVLMFVLISNQSSVYGENAEKTAWDVAAPAYSVAAQEIPLKVSEGTWMSLDVAPDGKLIVFDLLGDLYEIPINGGEASVLSAGHAWDMQPRYSPDGKSIAFVSDRAGGDNIWVRSRDDGSLRQITDESFRLLNSPVWSPDGTYLAARKHFTTSRSLGTGEIWLYYAAPVTPHGKGTKGSLQGVPVVERSSPAFQKELGEPAFSADGRHVFFTQNVTPGNTFIYHQDTNKEIFRIKQVELKTGEVSNVVGGPGGAVRTTPSPDGVYLAYVKRVRGDARLYIKALATGVERELVTGLDPDMQETWGVHGMYPNMAWLPDASALVFWSGGKIQRVEIGSGTVSEILFTVDHHRTVYPAPRPQIDVAPDTFSTRMVRFADSTTNTNIVFESLGQLFVKEKGAKPTPLIGSRQRRGQQASKNRGFEFYPTWDPAGKRIYYVHWHDKELGSVRSVNARGGQQKIHTQEPGHYVKPSL